MIVRTLSDIENTARDVDGGSWQSRRLVLAEDERAEFSLHDTVVEAGSAIKSWDRRHFQALYCIEGTGRVECNGSGTHRLEPGTVYVPDKKEPITLHAETDMRLVCVYAPPLTGGELPDRHGAFPVDLRRGLRQKNVMVLGLNPFNAHELESIRNAENYEYVPLLSPEDVLEREEYPMDEIVGKAMNQLHSFPDPIDAIIHYNDFPVSTMVPILCREEGLPSASLEAVLKCEHKYWSRIVQREAIPEHVPDFAAFDPFDDDAFDKVGLEFPFWVKPIKSFSSYLGFRINSPEQWDHAIRETRANIRRFKDSFNWFLDKVDLPDEIAGIGGGHCLAESIIGGRQCTQEGFVHKGEVKVYGTVDSIREPNDSSFSHYQYPSRLPAGVRKRMTKLSTKLMKHIGYDNAPFNIEYYWDANTDRIWCLEINPRISESHTDLFWKVDGASHHEVAVDLSMGHRPRLPYRDGEFPYAAKFFIRAYRDGLVESVPGQEEIDRLREEIPGTVVRVIPVPGVRLSELMDQDSYSYTLALLWIGGPSPRSLQKRFERAVDILQFDIRD